MPTNMANLQRARVVLRVSTEAMERGEAGVDVVERARDNVIMALARFRVSAGVDWRKSAVVNSRVSEEASFGGTCFVASNDLLTEMLPAHVQFRLRKRKLDDGTKATTVEIDVVDLIEILKGGV